MVWGDPFAKTIATDSPTFGRSHNPNWIVAACFSPFAKSKRKWWVPPRNRVNIPRLARRLAGFSIDVQTAIAFSPELITKKLFQLVIKKNAETTTSAIQNRSSLIKPRKGKILFSWLTSCSRAMEKINTFYGNLKQHGFPLLSNQVKNKTYATLADVALNS